MDDIVNNYESIPSIDGINLDILSPEELAAVNEAKQIMSIPSYEMHQKGIYFAKYREISNALTKSGMDVQKIMKILFFLIKRNNISRNAGKGGDEFSIAHIIIDQVFFGHYPKYFASELRTIGHGLTGMGIPAPLAKQILFVLLDYVPDKSRIRVEGNDIIYTDNRIDMNDMFPDIGQNLFIEIKNAFNVKPPAPKKADDLGTRRDQIDNSTSRIGNIENIDINSLSPEEAAVVDEIKVYMSISESELEAKGSVFFRFGTLSNVLEKSNFSLQDIMSLLFFIIKRNLSILHTSEYMSPNFATGHIEIKLNYFNMYPNLTMENVSRISNGLLQLGVSHNLVNEITNALSAGLQKHSDLDRQMDNLDDRVDRFDDQNDQRYREDEEEEQRVRVDDLGKRGDKIDDLGRGERLDRPRRRFM